MSLGGIGMGAVGAGLGVGGISSSSQKKAPLSDAMDACAKKCAYWVAIKLKETPWQGSVAKVDGARVMVNAGSNVGLEPGMTLKLLKKGEPVQDPDDPNAPPFFEVEEIGTIKLTTVQERFSMAEIVTGGKGAKIGDVVRLEPAGN